MIKYSVRQLMRNPNKVLADLPVELTIYNKTVAFITPVGEKKEVISPKKDNIIGQTIDPFNTPSGRCLHGAYRGYCSTCNVNNLEK